MASDNTALTRQQRRALKKARKSEKSGICGQLDFSPEELIKLDHITSAYVRVSASFSHQDKYYQALDGTYVPLEHGDAVMLKSKIRGLTEFIRTQHRVMTLEASKMPVPDPPAEEKLTSEEVEHWNMGMC